MKTKKTPERRCVGCGVSFPKAELIRVVRTPEGEVVLDATGRLNGRGAYLCRKSECFKAARRKSRLSTNLSVAIPNEVYDRLEGEIKKFEEGESSSVLRMRK